MFENTRVAVFLGLRLLKRGGKLGVFMNIAVIALVFMNMILTPSIILGYVQVFNEQTIDFITSDIRIEPKENEEYIKDAEALLSKINHIAGVRRASAHYSMPASLQFKDNKLSMSVIAFDPRNEAEVTDYQDYMEDGNYLGSGDTDSIMIGTLVAGHDDTSKDYFDSLGGAEVGDTITVRFQNGYEKDFRIKGIYHTKSWDADYRVFITKDAMDEVTRGEDYATEILVKTSEGEDPVVVKNRLLENSVSDDIQTWQEAMPAVVEESVESFGIINNIVILISIFITIVVIFIVTMIKTINHRRQIGILRAIGIEKSIIINSYVIQVLIVCLTAIIIGYITMFLMVAYFSVHPIEFPDGNVVPFIEIDSLMENTLILLFASTISGYVPAWKVVNENILDSMRRG